MTQAYIGLGSNVGGRMENLAAGLRAVAAIPGTTVEAVSHAYESEPWGITDQPPFVNAVARVRTELSADAFLGALLDAESAFGREPGPRFGPRPIDLDILLFGDEEWTSEMLTIPHPRMIERQFVMIPLRDVGSDARWPDGSPVTGEGWVGRVTADLGPIPGWEAHTPAASPPGEAGGEDWVAVAELAGFTHMDGVPDIGLGFKATVLEQEGIPFVYDPFEPTANYNPWGLSPTIRLKVPARFAERARRVLAEAESAPPLPPDA